MVVNTRTTLLVSLPKLLLVLISRISTELFHFAILQIQDPVGQSLVHQLYFYISDLYLEHVHVNNFLFKLNILIGLMEYKVVLVRNWFKYLHNHCHHRFIKLNLLVTHCLWNNYPFVKQYINELECFNQLKTCHFAFILINPYQKRLYVQFLLANEKYQAFSFKFF